jgi:hypothetical protein
MWSRAALAGAILLLAPGLIAYAADVSISNSYLSVEATGTAITSLRVDAGGRGRCGANLIRAIYAGDIPAPGSIAWSQPAPGMIVADPVSFYVRRSEYTQSRRNRSDRLDAGHTLGQSFSVDEPGMTQAGGCFPTWYQVGPAMTLTLRRDGPRGEIVASKRFYRVPDNSWQRLVFPPQPAGPYYLEMTIPAGTIGWWASAEDTYAGGSAFADGQPAPGSDRAFTYTLCDVRRGRLEIALNGRRLDVRALADGVEPQFRIITPWQLAGYDTSDPATYPFRAFISDRGQYLPAAELKRRATMDFPMPANRWLRLCGNGDFDLLLSPFAGSLNWTMQPDSMTLDVGRRLSIEVLPAGGPPEFYPEFFTSDAAFDRELNAFLWERALSWPLDPPTADWMEWLARIRDWMDLPGYLGRERVNLLRYKLDTGGYVYTWGDQKMWPFPDNEKYDARHFTTNAGFILGCWRYYCWTGDRAFLRENLSRLRAAMRFQLEDLHGKDGLLIMTSPDHDGTTKGVHSNYWDDIPFGYKSAYENIYFYASLEAMAQMLDGAGDTADAKRLRELRRRVRERYNREFWNDRAGRYIGCIDRLGQRHDYGFTYVNMEALAYGLGSPEQARRIYRWMETEPTQSGKPDTYSRYRFAPRVTTFDCSKWWYLEGKAEIPSQPWGTHCENGGAILYTSHFDILARANLLGADNAFQRLREILARYREPDRLCGGSPLYHGENNGWEVGTDVPFPESGLVPAAFLYAFLGIEAQADGLHIRPNLPHRLRYAGVRNLLYRNLRLDIRVTPSSVEISSRQPRYEFRVKQAIRPGAEYVFRCPPAGRFPAPPASGWQASWIWTPDQWREAGSKCFARRTFSLPAQPAHAAIWITADNAYRLYVNGRLLGADGDFPVAERYDIAPHLRAGRNVIAIECTNADGPAGLLAEAVIRFSAGKALRVLTDAAWKTAVAPAEGWTDPNFDDSSWQAAQSIARPPSGPWGHIVPEPSR